MTADIVTYRSRKNREASHRAQKEKREKIALAVCGVVLLALVAFEGPKMLKRMHGSSGSPAPVQVAAAQAATPAAAAAQRRDSAKALRRFAAKDPFVTQLGVPAVSSTGANGAAVAGPSVRESQFVAKDPFVQQLALSNPPAAGTPTSTGAGGGPGHVHASGSGDYIVVLASIPLTDGRTAARYAAATARASGVADVKIVDSSGYPTLRTGFYAVYSGPYATLAELQPALEQIRGQGYASAYTRRLAH